MKTVCIAILCLAVFSCRDSGIGEAGTAGGKILFEIEQVNYAWGFNYHGRMIGEDGMMYSYNPGKENIPVLFHADGFYTPEELSSKYQHSRNFIRKVGGDSIAENCRLAINVAPAAFSDTAFVGADMGSTLYSAYVYRPLVGKYQKLTLCVDGDVSFYNRSDAAIALTARLKKL